MGASPNKRPHVFISHAGDDKARIKPLIELFIAEGLHVWLDRPADIGLVPCDQTISGIPLHSIDFRGDITKALRSAACVLVFWSKNSINTKKKELKAEANFAADNSRLYQILIDDVIAGLPLGFAEGQLLNLTSDLISYTSSGEKTARLQQLINEVHKKLAETAIFRATVNGEAPAVPREITINVPLANDLRFKRQRDSLLPYLINRQPQEGPIVERFHEELTRRGRRARACVFVIPGPQAEMHEKFAERIRDRSVRRTLEQHNFADGWEWKPVNWPSAQPGKDRMTEDECLNIYLRSIGSALGIIGAFHRPDGKEAFATLVADHLCQETERPFAFWTKAFSEKASQLEAILLTRCVNWWDSLELSPGTPPPVVLFSVKTLDEGQKRSGFFTSTRDYMEEACIGLEQQRQVHAVLLTLPLLTPISNSDVNNWVETLPTEYNKDVARSLADKTFPPGSARTMIEARPLLIDLLAKAQQ